MAIRPSLAATVTTTKTVRLKPSLRRQLLTEFKAYQVLHAQFKALEHALDVKKGKIGVLRAETGEQSLELEGFKVTEVRGTRRKLNKQKFVQLGGSLTQLEEATETKPNKPYEKVSLPGDKDEDISAD